MQNVPAAVTFDVGQTLTELDCELLVARLAERDVVADPAALAAALPEAWRRYDAACATEPHPWHRLMHTLLELGKVQASDTQRAVLVDWLWSEQPKVNLWRRPIPGMIEIVRQVAAAGVKVAIISNSEGRLAQLIDELGWLDDFLCIADSGLLGVAKPNPEIFTWTGEQLGALPADFVHIGDSWSADILGITALGGRGIWFGGASIAPKPPADAKSSEKVQICDSPAGVAEALRVFGVPLC